MKERLSFSAPVISELAHRVYELLVTKYGAPVDCGRNRIVFSSRVAVFKLPANDYGMMDNVAEFRQFRQGCRFPSAPCRILHLHDMPVLMMLKVDTSAPRKMKLPDWAWFVDCAQVGLDRRGRVLAYDYA